MQVGKVFIPACIVIIILYIDIVLIIKTKIIYIFPITYPKNYQKYTKRLHL